MTRFRVTGVSAAEGLPPVQAKGMHYKARLQENGCGQPMKIIVCIKQVPVRDSQLRLDGGGRWIQETDLSFEINEPDAYALEEALQLKEKHGGEVIALCAGPERATQSIREALAKGADRAIHVREDNPGVLDTLSLARALAKAVEAEKPDLILTGLQSDDLGYGQTGVVMAELLGMPHATIIMEVEKQDGSIRVKRELENGWFQWITLPLPAVLAIQSGIRKLRYATLMGIKRAKTKEIRTVMAAELAVDTKPAAVIERVYMPRREKHTQILQGAPKQAAQELVEKLRFEVRVI
ncbi:MAG TPA: electron transfer flavoprotein subunit beta/FixA family protein [Bryobacteraceae bacterium]|nr:electron transfer flavoprotein subunit beta/FixA family protein [Bryobacteraceae bacterium]